MPWSRSTILRDVYLDPRSTRQPTNSQRPVLLRDAARRLVGPAVITRRKRPMPAREIRAELRGRAHDVSNLERPEPSAPSRRDRRGSRLPRRADRRGGRRNHLLAERLSVISNDARSTGARAARQRAMPSTSKRPTLERLADIEPAETGGDCPTFLRGAAPDPAGDRRDPSPRSLRRYSPPSFRRAEPSAHDPVASAPRWRRGAVTRRCGAGRPRREQRPPRRRARRDAAAAAERPVAELEPSVNHAWRVASTELEAARAL